MIHKTLLLLALRALLEVLSPSCYLTHLQMPTFMCLSRNTGHYIDYNSEDSIAKAAETTAKDHPLDLIIATNGILHDGDITPEKSLGELSAEKFRRIFEVNTVIPALIAKHFLPKLNREKPSRFAASQHVLAAYRTTGSAVGNAYRSSKAALNMIIKNSAIEIGRRNKQAIIVGLHPGTVDSDLSKPFQGNVPDGHLFTPEYCAQRLLNVLENLTPEHTGKCFAWDVRRYCHEQEYHKTLVRLLKWHGLIDLP